MPRTNYCLPVDVVRRFDPQVSQEDLTVGNYLDASATDRISARIEGVESAFETQTGTALRTVAVGSAGDTNTYEYLDAKRGWHFPVRYTLDHRNVLPISSADGDVVEVRTARNSWDDITADEGSRWVLIDNRQGKLEFYSRLQHTVQFRVRPGVRFIRLRYRYGGLGGSPTDGGETTIQSGLSGQSTPSSLSVGDASRLPAGGGTMLVGGTEYVRVTNVDASNDQVDIAERGLRLTDASESHSSGDTLHYCPMHVREAIAARAAMELQQYDVFVDQLVETGNEGLPIADKMESWRREWDTAVARYTSWRHS